MLETFLISLFAGATVEVSSKAISAAARYIEQNRPDLTEGLNAAAGKPSDAASVAKEIVGEIVAAAGTGSIAMDGATVEALREIKFDHQHGQVKIGNTIVSADSLVTGGSDGASGKTTIQGNTSMRSKGTSIEVGSGASIEISGDAKIEQN